MIKQRKAARTSTLLFEEFDSDKCDHATVAGHYLKKAVDEMIEKHKCARNGAGFISETSDSDESDQGAASNHNVVLQDVVRHSDEYDSDDEYAFDEYDSDEYDSDDDYAFDEYDSRPPPLPL